jgi:epoxyqueuosine reductase QueG
MPSPRADVDDPDLPDILRASLREAGVSAFGFLSGARLMSAVTGLDDATRARCGLDAVGGAVVAALAYGEGPSEPPAWAKGYPGPLAAIARFARANWYAELSGRFARAVAIFQAKSEAAGVDPGPAKSWRRFVNSSLPEKRLALEAGLGSIGRHSLLMLPESGSAAVIGVLITPLFLPDSAPPAPQRASTEPFPMQNALRLSAFCDGCGACLAACPTGALKGDGSIERELCLQHWSSVAGDLPAAVEAAWGNMLYGCDLCQEACPRFRPDPSARTERGLLGPGLPASWLAAAEEGDVRAALKGSALGMSWISIAALKRNSGHLTQASQPPTMRENGGRNGNL